MRINYVLEKYFLKYLWVLVGYLGLVAIMTASRVSLSVLSTFVFLIGLVYLVGAYGLLRKKEWAWWVVGVGVGLNFVYLILYPVILGIILNSIILYMAWTFRKKLGSNRPFSLARYFKRS